MPYGVIQSDHNCHHKAIQTITIMISIYIYKYIFHLILKKKKKVDERSKMFFDIMNKFKHIICTYRCDSMIRWFVLSFSFNLSQICYKLIMDWRGSSFALESRSIWAFHCFVFFCFVLFCYFWVSSLPDQWLLFVVVLLRFCTFYLASNLI